MCWLIIEAFFHVAFTWIACLLVLTPLFEYPTHRNILAPQIISIQKLRTPTLEGTFTEPMVPRTPKILCHTNTPLSSASVHMRSSSSHHTCTSSELRHLLIAYPLQTPCCMRLDAEVSPTLRLSRGNHTSSSRRHVEVDSCYSSSVYHNKRVASRAMHLSGTREARIEIGSDRPLTDLFAVPYGRGSISLWHSWGGRVDEGRRHAYDSAGGGHARRVDCQTCASTADAARGCSDSARKRTGVCVCARGTTHRCTVEWRRAAWLLEQSRCDCLFGLATESGERGEESHLLVPPPTGWVPAHRTLLLSSLVLFNLLLLHHTPSFPPATSRQPFRRFYMYVSLLSRTRAGFEPLFTRVAATD